MTMKIKLNQNLVIFIPLILTLFIMSTNALRRSDLKKGLHAKCSNSESEPDPTSDEAAYESEPESEPDSYEDLNMEFVWHRKRRSALSMERDECSEILQLKCINESCQIHCHPQHELYDPSRTKCVGRSEAPCAKHGSLDDLCVRNATCKLGYCSCAIGYGERNGTCVEAVHYGEACGRDRPCDKNLGMICRNGKCVCSFGQRNQWYDSKTQKCISYLGAECSSDFLCTENTSCYLVDSPLSDETVAVKMKRCACSRGFALSTNTTYKQCLASSGSVCHSNPCHESLKCLEGFCRCPSPSYEVFDNIRGRCVGLVGSHCSGNSSQVCVENAYCDDFSKCECKPGFSGSFARTCLLDIDQKCDYNYNIKLLRCNDDRGLACVGGRCECYDSIHQYNKANQTCVLTTNGTLLEMRHNAEQARLQRTQSSAVNTCQISFLNIFLISIVLSQKNLLVSFYSNSVKLQ